MPLLRKFPNRRNMRRMYEEGYAGVVSDPEAKERFLASAPKNVSYDYGFAGTGFGKLSILFPLAEYLYPGCLPGPGQECGDCVSHGEKNANLASLVAEILAYKPDEETGRIEGAPEVSAEGIKNGVLSSEWPYWFRGYNGDGWSCYTSAEVSLKYGIMIRKDFPELGFDLTKYSRSNAHRYGRNAPAQNAIEFGRQHLLRQITQPTNGLEEIADFIDNGFGINTCGGQGFSNKRNEHGVSRRSGSWSHAMSIWGTDTRSWAMKKYGGLVLIQNSWGPGWISGERIIHDSGGLLIPHGSFWARWADIKNRSFLAHSAINGWPPKELNDFGFNAIERLRRLQNNPNTPKVGDVCGDCGGRGKVGDGRIFLPCGTCEGDGVL